MNKVVAKWFSLLIVSSAVFLSVIDLFIVNVAIPSIKKGINGSDGDIQFVIVLYVIGYAAFLIMGEGLEIISGKSVCLLLEYWHLHSLLACVALPKVAGS